MPMPELDPRRYVAVMPVDPSHKVPRKDGLRFFSQDPANPDVLDLFEPYEAQLLAGGSLRRACDVETADAQAAAAKAAEEEQQAAAKAAAEKEPPAVKGGAGKPGAADPAREQADPAKSAA